MMRLLEPLGTVIVPATDRFVVRDHFFAGNTEVKIGYVDSKFTLFLLSKIEGPKEETELSYYRLNKASLNEPILKELGDESDTTLAAIWELLKLQPQGEDRILFTNTCANVFYVRDYDVFWSVYIKWCRSTDHWNILTCSVNDPSSWGKGVQFFSHNSGTL